MRAFGVAVALVVLLSLAYTVHVVWSARVLTADTVIPDLASADYPLAMSDITPERIEVLLAVEDPRFFEHGGVDLTTPGAGITTITQGLVKQLYFEEFTPGLAKLKQTLIAAFALDPLVSKEDQLTLFLNTAYFDTEVRGFEDAAVRYFGSPVVNLTDDQFHALVAMVIAPSVFDVEAHPSRNAERVSRIKRVVAGEHSPRGLLDVYYGSLDPAAQEDLPKFSYLASYYGDE